MIPISLYRHSPWCVRKCPYCDFNSHQSPALRPELDYMHALIADLDQDLIQYPAREIHSIFIGGGTPSLIAAEHYDFLFQALKARLHWQDNIEITLEANPGTLEHGRFADYRALGINRLSLGIQSFNPKHLGLLGRIHDDVQAHQAIEQAQRAGFDNINLDIMHSLPEQSISEALKDLKQAMSYQPKHISWYQLTLEPNTVFYRTKPKLPDDDQVAELEAQGFANLKAQGYSRYEISAFCQTGAEAQHNLNYWLVGDYFGIGAGAHGKYSSPSLDRITRSQKNRQPNAYMDPSKPFESEHKDLDAKDLVFEFMLNVSRLEQEIPYSLFAQRTGLSFDRLTPGLNQAAERGFIQLNAESWHMTAFGRQFANDYQSLFL